MDQSILELLGMYLILAIIFEEGFALLFKWRYFIKWIDAKGLKIPIMIGLSWWVFASYKLDIVSGILKKFAAAGTISIDVKSAGNAGIFLTAVLLAGGSATVYAIIDKYFDFRKYSETKKRVLAEEEEKAKSKKLNSVTLNKTLDKLKSQIDKSEIDNVRKNGDSLKQDLDSAFTKIINQLP